MFLIQKKVANSESCRGLYFAAATSGAVHLLNSGLSKTYIPGIVTAPFYYMYTNQNQSFLGLWDVVETQRRSTGEWLIAFFDEGRCSEIFRPEGVPEQITVCD